MSIRLMASIWATRALDLDGVETAVLVRLADFAADDGSSVYPSMKRLVEDIKFSESTVRRAIKSLIEKKLIMKIRPHSAQKHLSTVYKMNANAFYEGRNPSEPRGAGVRATGGGQVSERQEGRCQSDRRAGVRATSNSSLITTINNHHTFAPVADAPCDSFSNEVVEEKKKQPSPKPSKADSKKSENEFAEWYSVYPRKESRKKAIQAFVKALKVIPFENLMIFTKSYAKSVEGKDKQFIPYPASWLNAERWNDLQDLSTPQTVTPSSEKKSILSDPLLKQFCEIHRDQPGLWVFEGASVEILPEGVRLTTSSPTKCDRLWKFEQDLKAFFRTDDVKIEAREAPRIEIQSSPTVPKGTGQCFQQDRGAQSLGDVLVTLLTPDPQNFLPQHPPQIA